MSASKRSRGATKHDVVDGRYPGAELYDTLQVCCERLETDNANYRATIQRLMRDARLKDAVVEAARKFWNRSTWCPTDIGQAILALDAAQQQPQHASAANDDGQDARQ